MGALRFLSLAVGAVGGPMHPRSAEGGGGMYRFQPGQRAQKAEDQGQEHAGRCLVASSFLWPAEITIVI